MTPTVHTTDDVTFKNAMMLDDATRELRNALNLLDSTSLIQAAKANPVMAESAAHSLRAAAVTLRGLVSEKKRGGKRG